MNRLLMSFIAILLAAGLVGAGAFAYFSDTETSEDNTFNAGTMELKVTDGDPGEWGDGCSLTWVLSQIVPGADTPGVDEVTAFVTLKRLGSITPDHLEIQASVFLDESFNQVESDTNQSSTASEMAAKMQITSLTYNSLDLLNHHLNDADGDGFLTLNDMTYDPDDPLNPNGLDDLLPIPGTNVGTPFTMTLKWIEGAGDNDFQGDTLEVEIDFTLNQEAGQ